MPEMVHLIQRYGLEKHILVLGRVDRQVVLDCLNTVETVLLCSDNEGRPGVLYESMLETLTLQPKSGVFATTEPETMLSL